MVKLLCFSENTLEVSNLKKISFEFYTVFIVALIIKL